MNGKVYPAAEATDGIIVLVDVNQTDEQKIFELIMAGKGTTASLPAKCVGTYIWMHK